MRTNNRSQSALEYMMTYGWAILIIVIVAGVLYSLGVFNPSASASTSVTGFSGLGVTPSCANNNLKISLQNAAIGNTISISRINVTSNGNSVSYPFYTSLQSGASTILDIPLGCQFSAGSRYSAAVSVTYTEPGSIFSGQYVATGQISGQTGQRSDFIYVTSINTNVTTIISGSTNTITKTFTTGAKGPWGSVYDPQNNEIYIADNGNTIASNLVTVINSSNLAVRNITVGSHPVNPIYDPSNNEIYVPNSGTTTVSVIAASTNLDIANVTVQNVPYGGSYSYSNNEIYVANEGSNTVSVISGSSNTIVTTIPVGKVPWGTAFDLNNNELYVINRNSNTTSVINVTSNKDNIKNISTGLYPSGIIYNPSNYNLYVSNWNSNSVTVISGASNTDILNISVCNAPYGLVYDAADNDIYVSCAGSSAVDVISGATNTLVGSPISISTTPRGFLAVSS